MAAISTIQNPANRTHTCGVYCRKSSNTEQPTPQECVLGNAMLVESIFRELNHASNGDDLLRCTRVCKLWHYEAQRILYYSIGKYNCGSCSSPYGIAFHEWRSETSNSSSLMVGSRGYIPGEIAKERRRFVQELILGPSDVRALAGSSITVWPLPGEPPVVGVLADRSPAVLIEYLEFPRLKKLHACSCSQILRSPTLAELVLPRCLQSLCIDSLPSHKTQVAQIATSCPELRELVLHNTKDSVLQVTSLVKRLPLLRILKLHSRQELYMDLDKQRIKFYKGLFFQIARHPKLETVETLHITAKWMENLLSWSRFEDRQPFQDLTSLTLGHFLRFDDMVHDEEDLATAISLLGILAPRLRELELGIANSWYILDAISSLTQLERLYLKANEDNVFATVNAATALDLLRPLGNQNLKYLKLPTMLRSNREPMRQDDQANQWVVPWWTVKGFIEACPRLLELSMSTERHPQHKSHEDDMDRTYISTWTRNSGGWLSKGPNGWQSLEHSDLGECNYQVGSKEWLRCPTRLPRDRLGHTFNPFPKRHLVRGLREAPNDQVGSEQQEASVEEGLIDDQVMERQESYMSCYIM